LLISHIADSLGYTVEELVGKPGLALAIEKEKDTAQERMRKRQKGIKEQYEIWDAPEKTVAKFVSRTIGSPIKSNQGLHIGNLGMYVDITGFAESRRSSKRKQGETSSSLRKHD